MMLFGEKYPDPVRMISMGDFSRELCGGTHLTSTGQVGPFEVIREELISAGIRRITALTGEKAEQYQTQIDQALVEVARRLDCPAAGVVEAVRDLSQQVRTLKKRLAAGDVEAANGEKKSIKPAQDETPLDASQKKAILREAARLLNVSPFDVSKRVEALREELEKTQDQIAALARTDTLSAADLLADAETLDGVKIVVAETPGGNPNLMRQWIDQLRKSTSSCAVMLFAPQGEEKVLIVAGITSNLIDKGVHAGNWVGPIAKLLGGGGGGKPDMAQAGGKHPERIGEAIGRAKTLIKQMIGD